MNFISLCSGIEAASVALLPLGWKCLAVAEIEPFPCRLLKHYYPDVPNLGDINKITRKQIQQLGHVDVVIFGFPCQDLSVAGKRKGLKHADGTHTRSGLFYKCQQISDWSRARWTFAENVPGIFSHALGATFAHVVGEMAGCPLRIPGDGWRNAGAVLGKKGLVEWFVLDAQYAGLAQRRKRVFIIRDTGDWANRPPIFLKPQSLFGHPPSRKLPRQGTATGSEAGTGGSSVAKALNSSDGGVDRDDKHTIISHNLKTDGFDASEDGTGRRTPLVESPITAQYAKGPAANDTHTGRPHNLIPEVLPPLDASYGRLQGTDHQAANQGHPHLIPQAYGGNNTQGPITTATACNAHGGTGRHDFESETFVAELVQTETDAGHPAVAFEPRHFTRDNKTGGKPADISTLKADASKAGDSAPHVATQYAVRRLTPKECERLQGFLDLYTFIPSSSDGSRYKALGNSFAVPVIQIIGQRLQQLQEIK